MPVFHKLVRPETILTTNYLTLLGSYCAQMAASSAINRLQKDYGEIKSKPIPGVQVKVDDKNFLKDWQITFDGPV
ncbi:MAG: hypothetical protein EZS28_026794 [Streblomastix strix]|uniref:UBC core domain-containing protein n=1 Tax=Streblomastix strix TaxID=222440 RepID=A0A5J4V6B7_9EUKA|nr:MAG: hypothetical protein EZS28_026794 [Streblomastix strix]